jgi:hypothetical protein
MKTRQTVYNSIGLGMAALACLTLFSLLMRLRWSRGMPDRLLISYFYDLTMTVAMIVVVGGGSCVNLVANRMKPKLTVAMVVVYFLTCVLMPLGIWGIFELQSGRKRRDFRIRDLEHRKPPAPWFSGAFLRRAATLSWALSSATFLMALMAGASHDRSIIDFALVVFVLAQLTSFALALVVLLSLQEEEKKGIFGPAVIGISLSSFFIVMCGIALLGGIHEAGKAGQRNQSLTGNTPPEQTNVISSEK